MYRYVTYYRNYSPYLVHFRRIIHIDHFWPKDYKGDRTLLGKEMVDVDDSTKVYKIGGVSKKVRYNDFWPNYSDRYVAIELPEKIMVELDDELYPSSVEVCLRVKPGTSRDFAEHLMKLSATS